VNKNIHFRVFIKQKLNFLPGGVGHHHATLTPVKEA